MLCSQESSATMEALMIKQPKHLWRDDGERVTLNSDKKTYSFDLTKMLPKYKYSYDVLLSAGFLIRNPKEV